MKRNELLVKSIVLGLSLSMVPAVALAAMKAASTVTLDNNADNTSTNGYSLIEVTKNDGSNATAINLTSTTTPTTDLVVYMDTNAQIRAKSSTSTGNATAIGVKAGTYNQKIEIDGSFIGASTSDDSNKSGTLTTYGIYSTSPASVVVDKAMKVSVSNNYGLNKNKIFAVDDNTLSTKIKLIGVEGTNTFNGNLEIRGYGAINKVTIAGNRTTATSYIQDVNTVALQGNNTITGDVIADAGGGCGRIDVTANNTSKERSSYLLDTVYTGIQGGADITGNLHAYGVSYINQITLSGKYTATPSVSATDEAYGICNERTNYGVTVSGDAYVESYVASRIVDMSAADKGEVVEAKAISTAIKSEPAVSSTSLLVPPFAITSPSMCFVVPLGSTTIDVVATGGSVETVTTNTSLVSKAQALTADKGQNILLGNVDIVAEADTATEGGEFYAIALQAKNNGLNDLSSSGTTKHIEGDVIANGGTNKLVLDTAGSLLQGNVVAENSGTNDLTVANSAEWRPVYDNRYGTDNVTGLSLIHI